MNEPVIDPQYTLKELAVLMLRDKDIHEGLYDIAFKFQAAVGAIGPNPDNILPGAMLGVGGAGLRRVDRTGPFTVDAAQANPKPSVRKKTARK